MTLKKTAARAVATSMLGLAGLGVGAGLAQADPHTPMPPPPPVPGMTGPGVNAGTPGNPLPPGHGYLPPPGHGGPMPQDRIPFTATPSWVLVPVVPPMGTPPAPALPDWATGMQVVWNPDLGAWGVWDMQGSAFIRL
ncbi:hypothetical protein [Mycolicibacterium phocaicum]|jgi:hypothetical protein|uniref:Uncharacterized protein n=1 Tax=Mycolicibacterium phocaicum TaxID=319706 RepID=A0A7I7ZFU9_9MYCO|nr:hypothetical protein [Mycolicibacterium phocaicum]TLH65006.1 hypothetical protein C1S79_17695 [Mycolicibacterium phocaicum]UCZ58615.1 hypothetical protein LHJ73_17720 [Mycolicibacterium phocaicum]BBZ53056.1 hypothetical protein MPHO_00480 [Mycolicibacterium phocaicum]